MHETRILADLRRRLVEVGVESGPVRITGAIVWIGHFSHLDEGTLRERWEETVRGTAAEGCALVVHRSNDPTDPRALGVVLQQVEVEEGTPARSGGPKVQVPAPRAEPVVGVPEDPCA